MAAVSVLSGSAGLLPVRAHHKDPGSGEIF